MELIHKRSFGEAYFVVTGTSSLELSSLHNINLELPLANVTLKLGNSSGLQTFIAQDEGSEFGTLATELRLLFVPIRNVTRMKVVLSIHAKFKEYIPLVENEIKHQRESKVKSCFVSLIFLYA